MLIRHPGKKSRGKRENRHQADGKQNGREAPEAPGHQGGREYQHQAVHERIGVKRRPFHRESEGPAGETMVNPGEEPKPPPVWRTSPDLAAQRGVVGRDLPDTHFALREHLLRLGNPFVAGFIPLRYDQLTLAVGIPRRRVRRDDIRGVSPARQAGDILDPPHPGVIDPQQKEAGADRRNQPGAQKNPGR